jgi:hypothetical protein
MGQRSHQGAFLKLLKYVMTHDTGLAPNPYFGACSLALCTPNHMNARLEPGDWVVGHSSRGDGQRLVYAMRLTNVLDMPTYFTAFPEKRPDPRGSYERQCGDNMYYRDGDRWVRLPSAEHNTPECFSADQGRRVYVAEGADNYWYFGAASFLPELDGFADRFPWLIKDRQGFSYVRDMAHIAAFADWLLELGKRGLIGKPRDHVNTSAKRYLIGIDPEHQWGQIKPLGHSKGQYIEDRAEVRNAAPRRVRRGGPC